MSNTDNLTQRLRQAIDRALTFSDDVVDDGAVPFDDFTMRDRALAAFDAELRLPAPAEPPPHEDPHPGYDCAGTCVVHRFTALPAESKNTETIARFRDLKQNWDSYNAPPIRSEAIEIALLLAPVLPDWQPVPRSDGGIQFERDDHEINIDTYPTEPLTEPKDNKDA